MTEEYKQRLLMILKNIINICEGNNIKYFLTGGSLLGAVRHKGIIPWDDDIDIAMPRKDYDKFQQIMLSINHADIELGCFQNDSNYYLPFLKVFDKKSTLVEYKYPYYVGGIFIDVFPLDNVPNDKKEREKFIKMYYRWRNILGRVNTDWGNQPWGCSFRSVTRKMNGIITKLLFYKFRLKLLYKIDRIAKTYEDKDTGYVINFCGAWRIKEMGRAEIFRESLKVPFEDIYAVIPKGFDEYLTGMYGDYMVLPDEDKRISHHSHYYLNMNNRYRNIDINKISNK